MALENSTTGEVKTRRPGRPSNKERGIGVPAYLLKEAEKAAAAGQTIEQYRESKAKKSTTDTQPTPSAIQPTAEDMPLVDQPALEVSPSVDEVVNLEEPITEEVHEVRIKHTNDYDLFHFNPANRKLVPATLRELRVQIRKKNMLHLKPILVDKKMNIVDGQHRYTVAKEFGLTIYYIVGDVNDKEMLELNANQKSLVLNDYLDSYVAQGSPEYITVRDFVQRHNIMLYAAISLLAGRKSQANAELVKTFKSGEFKVRDLEHAERVLRIRDAMQPFAQDFYQQRKFTNAVAQVVSIPGFDEARLKDSLERNGFDQLKPAVSTELYAKQIVSVYNYKKARKNHLLLTS